MNRRLNSRPTPVSRPWQITCTDRLIHKHYCMDTSTHGGAPVQHGTPQVLLRFDSAHRCWLTVWVAFVTLLTVLRKLAGLEKALAELSHIKDRAGSFFGAIYIFPAFKNVGVLRVPCTACTTVTRKWVKECKHSS